MSDAFTQFRKATADEARLLKALLGTADGVELDDTWLEKLRVCPLPDGGMGSFRIGFGTERTAQFGKVASELKFPDADGVLVLASLNLDSEGIPFEVDVWKTDFSPLIRIPSAFD